MGYVELGVEIVPIAEYTRLTQCLIYDKRSSGIGRLTPSEIESATYTLHTIEDFDKEKGLRNRSPFLYFAG